MILSPQPISVSSPNIGTILKSLTENNHGYTTLISLCGAGGKTSTLFWLAEYFYKQGKRVLITTTTKMFLPAPSQYRQLVIAADPIPSLLRCQQQADGPNLIALFSRLEEVSGKVTGPSPEQIDHIKKLQCFDLILVEADGAHQKRLKVPALHEPCVPQSSDWVIALVAGAMMEAKADPEQIHRWPQLQALCGIKAGDLLDWTLFDRLLNHPQGVFKGSPKEARRIWFINGDYQNERIWQPELIALLTRHPEIEAIWQGAVRERAAIRHWLGRPPSGQRPCPHP